MKDKGINEFLQAAEIIKKIYPEIHISVCGFCDDKNYNTIIYQYCKKGIIDYYGMVKDPIPYYAKATCVVLPSYHEGMSNTLLEAASCGRPLITTNVHGCKETVNDNKTGYLVEKENTRDLAEKMIAFIKLTYEQKQKMGLLGRKKMEEEFDREIIVKKYLDDVNKIGEKR